MVGVIALSFLLVMLSGCADPAPPAVKSVSERTAVYEDEDGFRINVTVGPKRVVMGADRLPIEVLPVRVTGAALEQTFHLDTSLAVVRTDTMCMDPPECERATVSYRNSGGPPPFQVGLPKAIDEGGPWWWHQGAPWDGSVARESAGKGEVRFRLSTPYEPGQGFDGQRWFGIGGVYVYRETEPWFPSSVQFGTDETPFVWRLVALSDPAADIAAWSVSAPRRAQSPEISYREWRNDLYPGASDLFPGLPRTVENAFHLLVEESEEAQRMVRAGGCVIKTSADPSRPREGTDPLGGDNGDYRFWIAADAEVQRFVLRLRGGPLGDSHDISSAATDRFAPTCGREAGVPWPAVSMTDFFDEVTKWEIDGVQPPWLDTWVTAQPDRAPADGWFEYRLTYLPDEPTFEDAASAGFLAFNVLLDPHQDRLLALHLPPDQIHKIDGMAAR